MPAARSFFVFSVMKTIVAATGFSHTADNASDYAGSLAEQLNARLVLFHVYAVPVALGEMSQVFIPVEEMKDSSDEGLKRVKTELLQKHSSVTIDIESRLGDLNAELNDYCEQHHPDLVIIGNHHPEGLERILLGDSTVDLIRHLKTPVLAVPSDSSFQQIKDVAIAIDKDCTQQDVEKAKVFVANLGASVRFLHVQTKDEHTNIQDLLNIEDQRRLDVVPNESLVEGINLFIQKNQVQVLIIIPHQHSKLARLFTKTSTDELTQSIHIPIASIRS